MRSSRKGALLACLVVLAGCGGGDGDTGPRVVLTGSGGEQTVAVEVADTPAERERGLMNRASLPADEGMVFVWSSDQRGAFWMKDTKAVGGRCSLFCPRGDPRQPMTSPWKAKPSAMARPRSRVLRRYSE